MLGRRKNAMEVREVIRQFLGTVSVTVRFSVALVCLPDGERIPQLGGGARAVEGSAATAGRVGGRLHLGIWAVAQEITCATQTELGTFNTVYV